MSVVWMINAQSVALACAVIHHISVYLSRSSNLGACQAGSCKDHQSIFWGTLSPRRKKAFQKSSTPFVIRWRQDQDAVSRAAWMPCAKPKSHAVVCAMRVGVARTSLTSHSRQALHSGLHKVWSRRSVTSAQDCMPTAMDPAVADSIASMAGLKGSSTPEGKQDAAHFEGYRKQIP